MRYLFILFFIFFVSNQVLAQGNGAKPDKDTTNVNKPGPEENLFSSNENSFAEKLLPPGPETYSFAKYGNMPVSLNTGIPNIAIPLMSISDKDLVVEVNLSYHGSGIKVDEIASWVGLGWTLNAGGVITRSVYQKAETRLSSGQLAPARAYIKTYPGIGSVDDYISNNNLQSTANGGYDGQPDEFTFNFLGKTGKFYLDSTGAAVLYSYEGLKIKFEYVAATGTRFVILGIDGTRYEFAETEYQSNLDGNQSAIRSWYLTKIQSLAGGVITFEYQGSPAVDIELRQTETVVEITPNPLITPPPLTPAGISSVYEQKIKKIITSNGYVEMISSASTRQDIRQQSYALEYVNQHLPDGTLVKKTRLYTGYFEADNARKYNGPTPSVYNYLNYRLRLDSVQVYNNQSVAPLPPYKMTYLGDNNPAVVDNYTLPYRFSNYQDHWGYFNAKYNLHLFPGNSDNQLIEMDKTYEMFESPSQSSSVTNALGNGADRSVDTSAAKAAILSKMVYPSGGYTIFNFESHCSNAGEFGGGLRIQKISNYAIGQPANIKEFTYGCTDFMNHPKLYYYKYFPVEYITGSGSPSYNGYKTFLPPNLISMFGIPLNIDAIGTVKKYVKIIAFPQNILGSSSQISYSHVTVSETGKGRTESSFAGPIYFPDYASSDDFTDNIDFAKVPQLFQANYFRNQNLNVPISQFLQHGISFTDYPYLNPYSNEWKRGVLTKEMVYNESNKLLRETNYEYERTLLRAIKGWKVIDPDVGGGGQYLVFRYFLPQGWLFMKKQIVTAYDQNGQNPVTTTEEYAYENPEHAQLTRQSVTRSDGYSLVNRFNYAPDYASTPSKATFIQKMIDANMIQYPLEKVIRLKRSVNDSLVIDAEVTTYKVYSGNGFELIRPYKEFKFQGLDGGIGTGFNKYAGTTDESASSSYREILKYNTFDANGNPTLFTEANGLQTTMAWYTTPNVKNLLQSRTNASGNDEAQTTTFNHKPLVGVETITDPAGKPLFYEYDSYTRLKSIHSNNAAGAIRSAYCYNYANQATVACSVLAPSGSMAASALSLISNSTPLPVTLLDFEARKNEAFVDLNWSTASESNSDRFEIERSSDGKNWSKIGEVKSVSASAQLQTYGFTDAAPKTSGSRVTEILYRLKMVDRDETFAYSRIRNVNFDASATTLFPNPITITDKLQIASEFLDKIVHIQVYDSSGKLISSFRSTEQIDVRNWTLGLYTIQVKYADGSTSTHKIVKQ